MIQPPKPANEAARLEIIDRYGLTDPEREDIYDRIASLAADVFDATIALVSIVGQNFQCFRGASGIDGPGTPRNVAFCAFAILSDQVMIVEDATQDPRFAGNPLVPDAPNIRFYAGAPLILGGHAVGTLCVIDDKPRKFSAADRTRLVAMATTVVDLLNARLDRIVAENTDKRLREVMNAMPLGLVIWDRHARLVDYNDPFKETFFPHRNDGPELGTQLRDLADWIGKCGPQVYLDGSEEKWQTRMNSRATGAGEPYEVSLSDGRWLSISDVETARGELIAVSLDITERKNREAELALQTAFLRSTLDNVDEGIALFDSDRRLLVSNENFFELLQTGPNPEADDVMLCDLLQALAENGECEGRDAAFFKTGGVDRLELAERRQAGCRTFDGRHLDFQATGCRDGMMILICADVTEIKETERLKDEFVSTVSHELRTPLTSVSGSLDILNSGAVGDMSDQADHFLKIARNNCDRLTRLVNDLLEADKIKAGLLDLEYVPLNLQDLLVQSVENNLPYAESFDVALELLPASEPIIVRGDEKRLLQVADNLISNAIKHSPNGLKVTIALEIRSGFGRFVVEDCGPGIPKGFRRKVFERFAQADTSDHRAVQGTGLGLSIARSLVERQGGRIGFDTKLDRGTRFHVEIPLAGPPNRCDSTRAASQILTCLNDENVANSIAESLRRSGAMVEVVPSLPDAKQALKERSYDCLLVDASLTDGECGIELVKNLKEAAEARTLPVVRLPPGKLDSEDFIRRLHRLQPRDHDAGLDGSVVTRPPGKTGGDCAPSDETGLRILHVEDDPDLRAVVAQAFDGLARTIEAPDLSTARKLLSQEKYDLVVLDLMLPDGYGADLLPFLLSDTARAVPVVIFSAREANDTVTSSVDAALTKSKSSLNHYRLMPVGLSACCSIY